MQEERNAAEDLLGSEQLRELYAARKRGDQLGSRPVRGFNEQVDHDAVS